MVTILDRDATAGDPGGKESRCVMARKVIVVPFVALKRHEIETLRHEVICVQFTSPTSDPGTPYDDCYYHGWITFRMAP